MGEASRRGTYEERKKKAIDKIRMEMIANPPKQKGTRLSGSATGTMALVAVGMSALDKNMLSAIAPTSNDVNKYRKSKQKNNRNY